MGLLCNTLLLSYIIRKDRQRKHENRLQATQHHVNVDQDQDFVGVEPNSMAMVSTSSNPNWFLQEKPHDELRSPPTLTRAAGDEPFIVGTSIVRYSKELDRSSSYRPSTAQKYVGHRNSSEWKRAAHSPAITEVPYGAEYRMVRLGMIPPRPVDANGHFPPGYYTEPGRAKSSKKKGGKWKSKELEESGRYNGEVRSGMIPQRPLDANGNIPLGYFTVPGKAKSPKGKDGKRKSKEIEESRRYNGEVLVPGREVQLWSLESSSTRPTFALPKEDYNTEGATWYYSRSPDGQSLTSSRSENSLYRPSASINYPRHGPQISSSQNVNGRSVAVPPPQDVSPTTARAIADQYYASQDPDKLKRVKRVGVPILPE